MDTWRLRNLSSYKYTTFDVQHGGHHQRKYDSKSQNLAMPNREHHSRSLPHGRLRGAFPIKSGDTDDAKTAEGSRTVKPAYYEKLFPLRGLTRADVLHMQAYARRRLTTSPFSLPRHSVRGPISLSCRFSALPIQRLGTDSFG